MKKSIRDSRNSGTKVRYAVVGLGDIAQGAVLPAFAGAKNNSELVGLVSDDSKKLRVLAQRYDVQDTLKYEELEEYFASDKLDAVYIALPNSLHRDFALKAARAKKHILIEKPLAVTEQECKEIIDACSKHRVKLMTAYRLHFERANLEAIQLLRSGKLGDLRIFQSLFTMQVKPGNIRLKKSMGGGTLYDIGIYCINAARYLFGDEPTEVFAFSARNGDPRFREVDEMTTATMKFPKNRLASFSTSFGAADSAVYTVAGTKGILRMMQAYEYSNAIQMEVTIGGRKQNREYKLRDQFAAELLYFSDCILRNKTPEPDGTEGLLDVHIIRSLYQSAANGKPVTLKKLTTKKGVRPNLRQEIHRRPARRPPKVKAESPSR